jgi:putative transcriptional regulator
MTELSLSNRLREARSAAGLTQAELAQRIGVSRKTINTIENKVFVPSTLVALLIAQTLGRQVEDLFFIDSSETHERAMTLD